MKKWRATLGFSEEQIREGENRASVLTLALLSVGATCVCEPSTHLCLLTLCYCPQHVLSLADKRLLPSVPWNCQHRGRPRFFLFFLLTFLSSLCELVSLSLVPVYRSPLDTFSSGCLALLIYFCSHHLSRSCWCTHHFYLYLLTFFFSCLFFSLYIFCLAHSQYHTQHPLCQSIPSSGLLPAKPACYPCANFGKWYFSLFL